MKSKKIRLMSYFINSDAYTDFSDSQIASVLSDIYSVSKAIAENEVVGKKIADSSLNKKASIYNKYGAKVLAEYLVIKKLADTDNNGYLNRDEAEIAINARNLTRPQNEYLWEMLNSSDSWNKNNPYK